MDCPFEFVGRSASLARFTVKHRDDPSYIGWLNDVEVTRTLGRDDYVESVNYDQICSYFESVSRNPDIRFYAIHEAHKLGFIGTAKVALQGAAKDTADIGVMIGDKAFWNRGIATDVLGMLCADCFETHGLRKLTSGAMSSNPGMVRVFQKLGFIIEGVIRQKVPDGTGWADHVLMGCFPDEFLSGAADHASIEAN